MNDTTVGALAITFSVLVLMMPGMSYEGIVDESLAPQQTPQQGQTRDREENDEWRHGPQI